MGNDDGIKMIKNIEEILNSNLGDIGCFILDKILSDMGYTKDNFPSDKIETLIEELKKEFSKVIGFAIVSLEKEIRSCISFNGGTN